MRLAKLGGEFSFLYTVTSVLRMMAALLLILIIDRITKQHHTKLENVA